MDTIKLEQIIREKYGNTGAIIVQKMEYLCMSIMKMNVQKTVPFICFQLPKVFFRFLLV